MKSNWLPLVAVVLVAVVFVASIGLNLLLFRRTRGYYRELNEVRLDPLGLSYYAAGGDPQLKAPADRTTVVFLGDARAADWSAPDLKQFKFVNWGLGSQTSAQVGQRFADQVKRLQPHIVVVQVGIVDLKTILVFPERKASIVGNCKTNIQRIVEQSVNSGAQVVLTTVFPLGQVPLKRRLFWSDDVAAAIEDVNKFITSLRSENVAILDTAPVLTGRDGKINPDYTTDFLHLNAKGYAALNAELARILTSMQRS